ncbi:hypothetical protein AZF37_09715 (plasmid) [endosymbiont 'TC1' of Trimyema compressum]|uniref:phage tail protein n=1 Tax=endosymbiont 'TC1' of Trimyema compressum TaxID=243899 RepID=UPI0007F16BC2|nr:phage tail protein [endosymbiont 'TC1' of Trimyema compressum]AMP21450.1 hypothetical protein AZF37_09715 [endosymbiont 'TC1' of Trimyema compressum]
MNVLYISSSFSSDDGGNNGKGILEKNYIPTFVNRVEWVLRNCFNYQEQLEIIRITTPRISNAAQEINELYKRKSVVNTIAVDFHLGIAGNATTSGAKIYHHNDNHSLGYAKAYLEHLQPAYKRAGLGSIGNSVGNRRGYISLVKPLALICEIACVSNSNDVLVLNDAWVGSEYLVYGHAEALVKLILGNKYSIKNNYTDKFNFTLPPPPKIEPKPPKIEPKIEPISEPPLEKIEVSIGKIRNNINALKNVNYFEEAARIQRELACDCTSPLKNITETLKKINNEIFEVKNIASIGMVFISLSKTISTIAPIGTIVRYMGGDIPTGWRLCDGQEYDRNLFVDLVAKINLPDSEDKIKMPLIPNEDGIRYIIKV